MNERLKDAIDNFRDKVHELVDKDSFYPIILFPDSLMSSIDNFENTSKEDILGKCREIVDYEHDYLWHEEMHEEKIRIIFIEADPEVIK